MAGSKNIQNDKGSLQPSRQLTGTVERLQKMWCSAMSINSATNKITNIT